MKHHIPVEFNQEEEKAYFLERLTMMTDGRCPTQEEIAEAQKETAVAILLMKEANSRRPVDL